MVTIVTPTTEKTTRLLPSGSPDANPTLFASSTTVSYTEAVDAWAVIETVRPYRAKLREELEADDGWTTAHELRARAIRGPLLAHLRQRASLRVVTMGIDPTDPGSDLPLDD